VSDATYRIEIEHNPGTEYDYTGKIFAQSDPGYPVHVKHSNNYDRVENECRKWIVQQNLKQETRIFYTDDFGNIVPGHSVKVN